MIESRLPDNFELRFALVALSILALGVLSIYSVTSDLDQADRIPFYTKQIIWIGVGFFAFLAAMAVDYHRLGRFAYVIYGITLLVLVAVLIGGRSSRGAQRWFALGPFAFQPSELAKLVLVVVLAKYFAEVQRTGWLQLVVIPGLITLPGLLLILKQPDLGTAMSFMFIYLCDGVDRRSACPDLWPGPAVHVHAVSIHLGTLLDLPA